MTQTLDDLIAESQIKRMFKVVDAGRIIGSIRGHIDETGTCQVARLCVHPDHQRRGLGTALMHHLESVFAHARRFELFTGSMATDNIQLYQRLGYHLIDRPSWAPPVLVFLEKLPPS